MKLALTFDDGPSEFTLPLLDILKAHNAKATFFVLGKHCLARPREFQALKDSWHEIGNHSMNHLCLGDCLPDVVRDEIDECQAILEKPPGLFRPPYGRIAPTPVVEIAEGMGYKVVLWDICTGDWAAEDSSEVADQVVEEAEHGKIVLLHNGSPGGTKDRSVTVRAVEKILSALPTVEFCTVSELL